MEVISRSIRGPGTLLGLGWDSGYLWGVTVMLLTSMGLGLSLSRVGVSTPAGPGVSRLVPDVRDILDTAAGVTVTSPPTGGLFPNVISSRDILLCSAAASLIVSSLSSGSSTMVSSLVMVSSSTSLTTSGSQGLGMGLSGLKAELSPTRKGFSETQVWSL